MILGKEFLTANITRSNVLQTSEEQNLVNEPEKNANAQAIQFPA